MEFDSRRSVVVCRQGCVACSQPLAAGIGADILKAGGNAADAAVAVAAALNVTEPCSTGIGGDVFCLFYDARLKQVKGLNGSGCASSAVSLNLVNQAGFSENNPFPVNHGFSVTVPGAAAAWIDTVESFGSHKITMAELLKPAIELAEVGFPVQKLTAVSWSNDSTKLKDPRNIHGNDFLIDGRAPRHGEIMRMPLLAKTFQELSTHGKSSFYEGRIAKAITEVVHKFSGVMNMEDLQSHESKFVDPISVDYRGHRVWQIPPNGQGITSLMALNILEGYDLRGLGHNTVEYLHTLIEAMRLSFADSTWFCADPDQVSVPVKELLSKGYAENRRNLIDPTRAGEHLSRGSPVQGTDTVYFAVADKDGNACSFINSNYMGFGTGVVPEGCGFTLQNRGLNFSLKPSHPNVMAPCKRPYHTIIPSMVTSASGDLLASYGVMGGFMQPQGHVQVLLNMAEFHMDPQQALDQPRFFVNPKIEKTRVSIEEGIPLEVISRLQDKGHDTDLVTGQGRILFGRGQVITKGAWWKGTVERDNVYWVGSDPRADGLAIGY